MKKPAQSLYFQLTDNEKADKLGIVQKPKFNGIFLWYQTQKHLASQMMIFCKI